MDLVKVEVLDDNSIINVHVLKAGTVIELSPEDIIHHRARGIRLGSVPAGDGREVKNVIEPYVASE